MSTTHRLELTGNTEGLLVRPSRVYEVVVEFKTVCIDRNQAEYRPTLSTPLRYNLATPDGLQGFYRFWACAPELDTVFQVYAVYRRWQLYGTYYNSLVAFAVGHDLEEAIAHFAYCYARPEDLRELMQCMPLVAPKAEDGVALTHGSLEFIQTTVDRRGNNATR